MFAKKPKKTAFDEAKFKAELDSALKDAGLEGMQSFKVYDTEDDPVKVADVIQSSISVLAMLRSSPYVMPFDPKCSCQICGLEKALVALRGNDLCGYKSPYKFEG